MPSAICIDEFRNHARKAEGFILLTPEPPASRLRRPTAWVSVFARGLQIAFLMRYVLRLFGKIEQVLDLREISRPTSEQILPLLREMNSKYQAILPGLLNSTLPLIGTKERERLEYYSEYFEDVIEALEIGLDHETASRIEALASDPSCSIEIQPWREALGQM